MIASDQAAELRPLVERFVDQQAHLMTDQNWAYQQIGKDYAAHSWVNHSAKEFARGDVHNNTAESFNSLLERAKQGIFHHTLVIPAIVKCEVVDAGKAKDCDDAFVVEKNISKISSPLLLMPQTTQRTIVHLLIFFPKRITMQLQPMMQN